MRVRVHQSLVKDPIMDVDLDQGLFVLFLI
jgi:hypothetical protein